ncbi:MAG: transposase [Sedimentisphaerales bacterium]|nr:transposase [Sedimentisphaerales bacterium]
MPRSLRQAKGGVAYHVFNRANGRLRIFKTAGDFLAFEQLLGEGAKRFGMRICGYCLMSNHWHLLLWPRCDGDLSAFMKWVTGTHSHRWHAAHGTVGIGHLYQGRYKSFPVQGNIYYLTLLRYIESNPRRAGLVQRARRWPWSSLAIRLGGDKEVVLSDGPFPLPAGWPRRVDALDEAHAEAIETCIRRGRPFGDDGWVVKTAKAFGLESALRPRGRPRKEGKQ